MLAFSFDFHEWQQWLSKMVALTFTEDASRFGAFAAGVGIIILTAFVVYRGRRQWRKSIDGKSEYEVASGAYVAAVNFLDALEYLSTKNEDLYALPAEEKGSRSRARLQERLALMANDFQALNRARSESAVYLSEGANLLLDDLWKQWIKTRTQYDVYLRYLESGITDSSLTSVEKFLFEDNPVLIRELRTACNERLRTLVKKGL